MINAERINSQLSHGKFKRFNLFFCMLVLKLFTLLFTIDTERINSLCMWKGDCLCMWKGDHLCMWKGDHLLPLHMKRQLPLYVKRWLPLLILGDWWLMQRGSTVNFHMENSKDLTYFSCMLVLKLFTLLFTIDAERINSLCMSKGDCFYAWKGDHLCTWKGDCPCEWKGNHLCWSCGNYDQCREDQQSTFTWKIQKI